MLTLKILFWVCLFIVFYTYIGYGILLYLIIRIKRLVKGKKAPTPMPTDEELPTMTLMICAYNEQDIVAEKMENTRALDYPKDKFRVMWVTDGRNDRTNELLAAYLDGNTNKEETQLILQAMSQDTTLQEILSIAMGTEEKNLPSPFNASIAGKRRLKKNG